MPACRAKLFYACKDAAAVADAFGERRNNEQLHCEYVKGERRNNEQLHCEYVKGERRINEQLHCEYVKGERRNNEQQSRE